MRFRFRYRKLLIASEQNDGVPRQQRPAAEFGQQPPRQLHTPGKSRCRGVGEVQPRTMQVESIRQSIDVVAPGSSRRIAEIVGLTHRPVTFGSGDHGPGDVIDIDEAASAAPAINKQHESITQKSGYVGHEGLAARTIDRGGTDHCDWESLLVMCTPHGKLSQALGAIVGEPGIDERRFLNRRDLGIAVDIGRADVQKAAQTWDFNSCGNQDLGAADVAFLVDGFGCPIGGGRRAVIDLRGAAERFPQSRQIGESTSNHA